MKYLSILIIAYCSILELSAQVKKTDRVNISYFGAQISRPGLAISFDHLMKERSKSKNDQSILHKTILSPELSGFYWGRYQLSLQLIPQISYMRERENGSYRRFGIGAGYMMNIVPRVFSINILETLSGPRAEAFHKLAFSVSAEFGKTKGFTAADLGYFIKPQFLYSVPSYPLGTGILIIQIGISKSLKTKTN